MAKQFGTLVVMGMADNKTYTCKCVKCGRVDVYDKYNLEHGNIKYCRFCKKFNGIEIGQTNAGGLTIKGYRDNKGEIEPLVVCNKCKKEFYISKEKFKANARCIFYTEHSAKTQSTQPNTSKPVATIKRPIVKYNGPVAPKKEENIKSAITEDKKSEALRVKKITKKYENAHKLYSDYTDKVINGLKIVEQSKVGGVVKAKLICTHCGAGKTKDDRIIANLVDVLEGRVTCDNCADAPYRFECPACKEKSRQSFASRQTTVVGGVLKEYIANRIVITRGQLYGNDVTIKCEKCGADISIAKQRNIEDMIVGRDEVLKKLDPEKYGYYANINDVNKLAVCSEVAYTDRDGKSRFNCICLSHGKKLCLTKDETVAYNHERCKDSYMQAVPLLKKKEPKKKSTGGDDDVFYY